MGGIRYSEGGASVEISADTERAFRDSIGEIERVALDKMQGFQKQAFANAYSSWPVGGRRLTEEQPVRSRDTLSGFVEVSSDSFRAVLRVTAWWAKYIKSPQNGLGRKPALRQLLVVKPSAELGPVAIDLSSKISELFRAELKK